MREKKAPGPGLKTNGKTPNSRSRPPCEAMSRGAIQPVEVPVGCHGKASRSSSGGVRDELEYYHCYMLLRGGCFRCERYSFARSLCLIAFTREFSDEKRPAKRAEKRMSMSFTFDGGDSRWNPFPSADS